MRSSLNAFYAAIGISKQGLHHHLNSQLAKHSLFGNLQIIVISIRKDHPILSSRAMYYKIQPEEIGRDKFEQLCCDWGLTQTKIINRARTTFSTGVIQFENHYKDIVFTGIGQALVSDITYLRSRRSFLLHNLYYGCF